jgi:hypothetical protein
MALTAGLPGGPFGGCPGIRLLPHRRGNYRLRAYGTPPGPLDRRRGFAGATAAVVLGWLTVLIAAVTAGLAA